jgi:hypothetical protein
MRRVNCVTQYAASTTTSVVAAIIATPRRPGACPTIQVATNTMPVAGATVARD